MKIEKAKVSEPTISVILESYLLRRAILKHFLRPHMGFDGKTPAKDVGIKIEGENHRTLIQKNTKYMLLVSRLS